jgi:hypothetical protein
MDFDLDIARGSVVVNVTNASQGFVLEKRAPHKKVFEEGYSR